LSHWPPDLVIRSAAGGPIAVDYADLADVEAAPVGAHVAFSGDGVDRTPAATDLPSGEKVGARDTMDRLAKQMRQNGASAEYAERHTRTAARSWDRGIETGRIQRPKP
jgi:hypothetical protein